MHTVRYGTCSWSEKSWVGAFYPPGTRPADCLRHYAQHFDTVEADSTYYAAPAVDMVRGWYDKTPPGFVLACKLPRQCFLGEDARELDPARVLTAAEWEGEVAAFCSRLELLGEKAGPVVIQCPYFNQRVFPDLAAFLARLQPYLAALPAGPRWVLEVRNPQWLQPELFALLRERRVAFCLTNVRGMPHPADVAERFDVLTAGFFYGRLIGDRDAVERLTKTFDRVVIDQS